jgi:hypothetical protein
MDLGFFTKKNQMTGVLRPNMIQLVRLGRGERWLLFYGRFVLFWVLKEPHFVLFWVLKKTKQGLTCFAVAQGWALGCLAFFVFSILTSLLRRGFVQGWGWG